MLDRTLNQESIKLMGDNWVLCPMLACVAGLIPLLNPARYGFNVFLLLRSFGTECLDFVDIRFICSPFFQVFLLVIDFNLLLVGFVLEKSAKRSLSLKDSHPPRCS